MNLTGYANHTVNELAQAVFTYSEAVANYTALQNEWLRMNRHHPKEAVTFSNLGLARDLMMDAQARMENVMRNIDTSITNLQPPF